MDGYLGTQLLYVAAELDLMEALRGAPRSAAEVAAVVEADAATLERVLRGLAAYGVVVEHPGRRFAASPLGELLCADRPGAQRGAMLARGQVYYAALGGLLAAVRSGGVPFESVHGERFFTHLAAHPELVGAFQASMRDRSAREAAAVVAAYDFAVFGTVVDVGGGGGVLLKAILDAAPEVSGVLFDRPEVAARSPLPAVAGDFFVEVPAGADAYLLSRVIHDWSDADAVAILRTLPPGDGRLRPAPARGGRAARAGGRPPGRHPDGPAHARPARRPGAHPRGVRRAARRGRPAAHDGRARRPGVGRARVRGPPRLTGSVHEHHDQGARAVDALDPAAARCRWWPTAR